jgi:hypothetical protein
MFLGATSLPLILLPLGEGARRADEGLTARSNSNILLGVRPSSGLSATFPQRGKGES